MNKKVRTYEVRLPAKKTKRQGNGIEGMGKEWYYFLLWLTDWLNDDIGAKISKLQGQGLHRGKGYNVSGRENGKCPGSEAGESHHLFQFSYQMKRYHYYIISRVCRVVFSFHNYL